MQRDKQGDTPLHLAVGLPGCHKEVVDLLLRHSPEKQVMLGNAVGQLPLVGAACGNKWEIMRLLLVVWPGRQVLHRDESLNSALAYAADLGHAEAMRLLLAHSPDHQVLQSGQEGHNALTLAVLGGHQEVVRLLLEHSPLQQVAHRLESGVTASMLAAARGDADVLQLLLLYVGDTDDLNAALAAIQVQPLTQGHRRCCQLLFMHGASAAALPTAKRAVVENVLRDVLQQYQVPSIIDRAVTGAGVHKLAAHPFFRHGCLSATTHLLGAVGGQSHGLEICTLPADSDPVHLGASCDLGVKVDEGSSRNTVAPDNTRLLMPIPCLLH